MFPSPVWRSIRGDKGETSMFRDYVAREGLDVTSLLTQGEQSAVTAQSGYYQHPAHTMYATSRATQGEQYAVPARCGHYQHPATARYSLQQPQASYPVQNLGGYDVPGPAYNHRVSRNPVQSDQYPASTVYSQQQSPASMSSPYVQYAVPVQCAQYPAPTMYSRQQSPASSPDMNLSGYDVPCPTYSLQLNQIYGVLANQYDTHLTPPCKVFSPEQNKAFVFDGSIWNEFSLEPVISRHIPCQESPRGGT